MYFQGGIEGDQCHDQAQWKASHYPLYLITSQLKLQNYKLIYLQQQYDRGALK